MEILDTYFWNVILHIIFGLLYDYQKNILYGIIRFLIYYSCTLVFCYLAFKIIYQLNKQKSFLDFYLYYSNVLAYEY